MKTKANPQRRSAYTSAVQNVLAAKPSGLTGAESCWPEWPGRGNSQPSLISWPNGPEVRLIPICRRRSDIGVGRPDLFGGLQHKFDDVLRRGDTTLQVDNAVVGQHGPCGFYFLIARHGDLQIDRRTIEYFLAKKPPPSRLKKTGRRCLTVGAQVVGRMVGSSITSIGARPSGCDAGDHAVIRAI
jgi:hypothetical protein